MPTPAVLTPRQVLQTRLDAYLQAEQRILLDAQAYQVGDGATARQLSNARLEEVRAGIAEVQAQIGVIDAARTGRRRVVYLR